MHFSRYKMFNSNQKVGNFLSPTSLQLLKTEDKVKIMTFCGGIESK